MLLSLQDLSYVYHVHELYRIIASTLHYSITMISDSSSPGVARRRRTLR